MSKIFVETEEKLNSYKENKEIYEKVTQFVDNIDLCPTCGLPAERKRIENSFLKIFTCPYDHVYHYGFDGDRWSGDGYTEPKIKLSHNPNIEPVNINTSKEREKLKYE
jgi:hypothetical protein